MPPFIAKTIKQLKEGFQSFPLTGLALISVATLVLADLIVGLFINYSDIALEPVDIQSPETLCLKIEKFRRASGQKVLVLGDSLAFGEAMSKHGDKNWRRHDLASALNKSLHKKFPKQDIVTLNLGLTGGLPADQLAIVKLMKNIKIDLVVMTVGIRSFSSAFAPKDKENSRKWLKSLQSSDLPACRLKNGSESALERTIGQGMATISWLYRSRIFWNDYFLGGSLKNYVRDLRKSWNKKTVTKAGGVSADIEVLLLAKGRYTSITFAEPHIQVEAFKKLRQILPKMASRTVVIYGRENPKMRRRLITKRKYKKHLLSLEALVQPDNDKVFYIKDAAIPPAQYLDYVHVNAQAYQTLADKTVNAIHP